MRAVDEAIPLPIDDAPLVTLFAAFFAASACWIVPAVPPVASDAPGTPCFLSMFAAEDLNVLLFASWLIPSAPVTVGDVASFSTVLSVLGAVCHLL